jgi:hypothetical protein
VDLVSYDLTNGLFLSLPFSKSASRSGCGVTVEKIRGIFSDVKREGAGIEGTGIEGAGIKGTGMEEEALAGRVLEEGFLTECRM